MYSQLSASSLNTHSSAVNRLPSACAVKHERIQFLDSARGISILLVVLGHNWIVHDKLGEPGEMLGSFRMPLFFFLSGIFLPYKKSVHRVAIEKADALLKPYFLTAVLVGFCLLALAGFNMPLRRFVFGVVYGTSSVVFWAALWFLPALYLVMVGSRWLVKISGLEVFPSRGRVCMVLCSVLLCGFGLITASEGFSISPLYLGREIELGGLPWSLNLVGMASFFYLLGFVLKDKIRCFNPDKFSFLANLAIFLGLHTAFEYTHIFAATQPHQALIALGQALSGIYVMLSFTKWLCVFSSAAHVVAYIGSGSLFILIWHSPVQMNLVDLLTERFPSIPYINLILSFLPAIVLPLAVWEIVKKSKILSTLYLPLKSTNHFRHVFETAPALKSGHRV